MAFHEGVSGGGADERARTGALHRRREATRSAETGRAGDALEVDVAPAAEPGVDEGGHEEDRGTHAAVFLVSQWGWWGDLRHSATQPFCAGVPLCDP
jgi:hypothetical protein